MAFRAAESAASPAAYGVLFREPLKPAPPELPQLNAFPLGSVIVTMVLLKLDWIYARPIGTFFRSRRRARVVLLRSAKFAPQSGSPCRVPGSAPANAGKPRKLPSLLLGCRLLTSGDCPARALTHACIRSCPLTANRKIAPVANSAVAADFHEPLDIEINLAP